MELDLKNETLGVKHKKYNQQVNNAIAERKTLGETEFKPGAQDLDNLMKIDIASYNKNVNYILSVLQCKDMLYVSRALCKSKWLIEDQYAHIINPQNLRDQVFPHMTTQATIKMMKFIRQNLKNESRVEEFLKVESDPKVAAKWLSRCSVTFIEENVQTYKAHMEYLQLKRLCEKSVTIFDAATAKNDNNCRDLLKSASFLMNTHLEKYLDVVERVNIHERPTFNAKATSKILKQFSERVKNKFEIYSTLINIPTFVKHFKSEDIKAFLYEQANKESSNCQLPPSFYKYTSMKEFVLRMPKEEQFDFVKELFIDKAVLLLDENTLVRGSEMFAAKALCKAVSFVTASYVWYEFAPFEIAFTELKKLIHSETNFREKKFMLKFLLICATNDMNHLQSVFSYYIAQHVKDEIQYKNYFIGDVVAYTDIHKYDDATWILLNKILVIMDVYKEGTSTHQNCLETVIIHNLLEDVPIPEEIEKKISFYTLHNYQKKLNNVDGNKVFEYLYNHAKKTIESTEMNSQEAFNNASRWLNYLVNLLLDWNKNLPDYPFILETIKDIIKMKIKMKEENNWKLDLSQLYNRNKSWRKHMFEESVILNPTEDVCVNAIKHDPSLLGRYKDEVETICWKSDVSLEKLLNKLRIYWPNSLAGDWSKSYVSRLDQHCNHKALIRGLCALLPPNDLNVIIRKYAPQQAKIDWSQTDELSLSLQRNIAQNMHFARPQPSPDDILLYAKGDYLQYALPSLLAINYNLSRFDSKAHVTKLLDAPVSLQKHGLRLAFFKLDHNEVKLQMSNIWKTSKNRSIRTVVFQLTFELLRKEKNDDKAQELWELLEVFIDNLSFQEDNKIYELLPRVDDVPLCVRPMFLVKSYKFLKNLIQNNDEDRNMYQYHVDRLAEYTRNIMASMSPEFVADIITDFMNTKFFLFDKNQSNVRSDSGMVTVLSAYLLCSTEDIQMQRYEKLLTPVLKRSLSMWHDNREGIYYMRNNTQQIFRCLLADLKNYVIKENMPIPTKMFIKIQNELQNLPVSENYLMITTWKLTVKLAELIEKSNVRGDWNNVCVDIFSEYGKICLECLKEDTNSYFSCIYVLYSKALEVVVGVFPLGIQLQIFEYMLSDSSFIQAYLATLKVFPKYGSDNEANEKKRQLKKMIQDHPSAEVKMHYYSNFKIEA